MWRAGNSWNQGREIGLGPTRISLPSNLKAYITLCVRSENAMEFALETLQVTLSLT